MDRETANAVEFFVDDRVFGFSQKLMDAPDVVAHGMWIMQQADTGWDRDIHPYDMAPLGGLLEDIRLNGPPDLQWNIALYDDPYFHIADRNYDFQLQRPFRTRRLRVGGNRKFARFSVDWLVNQSRANPRVMACS